MLLLREAVSALVKYNSLPNSLEVDEILIVQSQRIFRTTFQQNWREAPSVPT